MKKSKVERKKSKLERKKAAEVKRKEAEAETRDSTYWNERVSRLMSVMNILFESQKKPSWCGSYTVLSYVPLWTK